MTEKQVLLVDDSKSARYALRLQLQYHGVKVDTAESAEAALVRVREDPPDAIFLDHMMPGMNGFEALEALKRDPLTANIPVVICTTGDDSDARRRAWDKGAVALLPKAAASEKLPDILSAIDAARARSPATTETAPELNDHTVAEIARREANSLIETTLKPRIGVLLEQSLGDLRERVIQEVLKQTEPYIKERLNREIEQLRQELQEVKAKQATTRAESGQGVQPEAGWERSAGVGRAFTGALKPAYQEAPANDSEAKLADDHRHSVPATHRRLYLLAAGAVVVTLTAAALVYVTN